MWVLLGEILCTYHCNVNFLLKIFFATMRLCFARFFRAASLPVPPWFCQTQPIPSYVFLLMSVILWSCFAVLLMLLAGHINTSNFDSFNILGLGRLPHASDFWFYILNCSSEKGHCVVEVASLNQEAFELPHKQDEI